MLKTNVYIDAFNLYYGILQGSKCKWLDVRKLAAILLPKHQIVKIKYFTALVNARENDPDQPMRQQMYLRALGTLPEVEIYYGHFLTNSVAMPLVEPLVDGTKYVKVIKTEEKGSDVNLASQLLRDGFMNSYECAVLVTGDSDLLMPMKIVREELHKPVGVVNPRTKPSRIMQRHATFYKHIRHSALLAAQFPDELHDAQGIFHKPEKWS